MNEVQDSPVKPVLTPAAAKRANASVIGMVLALLVSVLAFGAVVLLNPANRAETYQRNVDVAAIAVQARSDAGFAPLAATLPEGWRSNYARWNAGTADGVPNWEVGYLTPGGNFIALTQTVKANSTWLAQRTEQAPVTGSRDVGGLPWELRDKPRDDTSLILDYRGTTVLLRGIADLAEFDVLGGAVVTELTTQN